MEATKKTELQPATIQHENNLESDLSPLVEQIMRQREKAAEAERARIAGSDSRLTIRFDPETFRQLRKISSKKGTPVSTMIKNLVKKWLADVEGLNVSQPKPPIQGVTHKETSNEPQ